MRSIIYIDDEFLPPLALVVNLEDCEHTQNKIPTWAPGAFGPNEPFLGSCLALTRTISKVLPFSSSCPRVDNTFVRYCSNQEDNFFFF